MEELIEKIRSEALRRRTRGGGSPSGSVRPDGFDLGFSGGIDHLKLEPLKGPRPFEPSEDGYALRDFLRFHDRDFVNAAYRGILKRAADPGGLDNYLEKLRSGAMTRTEILGRLRYSPEGRAKAVRVKGLLRPFLVHALSRIPVAGYPLRWLAGLLRIPALERAVEARDAAVQFRLSALQGHVDRFSRAVQEKINDIIDSRPSFAGEERGDTSDREEDPAFHAFHAAYLERTAPPPEKTRLRHEAYLAMLKAAGAGTPLSPVLDLGCGLGGWLAFLKEQGIEARGIDQNPVLVRACLGRGLSAARAEAVDYVRGLEPDSAGAITCLHLAEHLSFPGLVSLLQEARRVLKPGGPVILETVNPNSAPGGWSRFFEDPTRRLPIPPAVIQTAGDLCGFTRNEILFLPHASGDSAEESPDYCWIGYTQ